MVSEVTRSAGQASTLAPAAPVGDPPAARATQQADVAIPQVNLQVNSSEGSVQVKSSSYAELATQRESQFLAAQQARETFKAADAGLGAIKARFEQIIKQYPPYPLDSPQRITLLNEINGLRQQVEKLQLPGERTDAESASLRLGFGEIDPANTGDAQVVRYYQNVVNVQARVNGSPAESAPVERHALSGAVAARHHFATAPGVAIGANRELLSALA